MSGYNGFDIPILKQKGFVPGSGPRVALSLHHERSATFPVDEHELTDMATCKWVGELLHSHYRGHFWMVKASSRGGLCQIGIPVLLGNWTWNIPLKDLEPWLVIKAGGEILERFKIPRSSIDVAAFVEARKHAVSRASQKPPS